MAVGDLYRFTIFASADPGIGLNVVHYRVDDETGVGAGQDEMITAIVDEIRTPYRNCMSENAALILWRIQKISPVTGIPISDFLDSEYAVPTSGLVDGNVLPANVAGLMTLRTGTPGRANRGRFYSSYPAESDNTTPGEPGGGIKARLLLLADGLMAAVTAGTVPDQSVLNCVIFSKSQGISLEVTSATARPIWGSQRRRRKGIGI